MGNRRWPAEWERHDATWIAWPHHEPDWPGKLGPIPWAYAEIVRALHRHERVEILCNDQDVQSAARKVLDAHGVSADRYSLHIAPTDRVWLRDSAPTFVDGGDGKLELIHWGFNGWAKYDNYSSDVCVGNVVEKITGLPRVEAKRPGSAQRFILEGGGIESDGTGNLLVTEEWLLSDVQVRNPGMTRADYDRAFADYLGIRRTIWLGEGCVGDDTHGHVDDVARFLAPNVIALTYESDPADENHLRSVDNLRRLETASRDTPFRIVPLPFPRPITMNGERLPASYANFYIANGVVIVPTFNDPNDRVALNTLADWFPDRDVVGINSVDLVWGLGTLHCLTQQQPAASHRSESEGMPASAPVEQIGSSARGP